MRGLLLLLPLLATTIAIGLFLNLSDLFLAESLVAEMHELGEDGAHLAGHLVIPSVRLNHNVVEPLRIADARLLLFAIVPVERTQRDDQHHGDDSEDAVTRELA